MLKFYLHSLYSLQRSNDNRNLDLQQKKLGIVHIGYCFRSLTSLFSAHTNPVNLSGESFGFLWYQSKLRRLTNN